MQRSRQSHLAVRAIGVSKRESVCVSGFLRRVEAPFWSWWPRPSRLRLMVTEGKHEAAHQQRERE